MYTKTRFQIHLLIIECNNFQMLIHFDLLSNLSFSTYVTFTHFHFVNKYLLTTVQSTKESKTERMPRHNIRNDFILKLSHKLSLRRLKLIILGRAFQAERKFQDTRELVQLESHVVQGGKSGMSGELCWWGGQVVTFFRAQTMKELLCHMKELGFYSEVF